MNEIENVKIGIVTVTYNSGEVLKGFMESLMRQTYKDYVVYLIDNASKDDTLLQTQQYLDRLPLVVVPNSENVGVAAGNNQGIRQALADGCSHVLLLNNDTEFEERLFEKMLQGLQEMQCGMIVPKLMYHDEPKKIWYAGGHFNKIRPYLIAHEGFNEADCGQYDRARIVEYAPTCCMLVKKEVFAEVGLMDEKYFVYYDDTDFCLRALKKKFLLAFWPDAVLYHKVSSLTGGESDFSIRYYMRNKVYFIKKYMLFPFGWLFLLLTLLKLEGKRLRGRSKIDILRRKAFFEGLAL